MCYSWNVKLMIDTYRIYRYSSFVGKTIQRTKERRERRRREEGEQKRNQRGFINLAS